MGVWIDPLIRFWSKVEVRGPDECWPWVAKAKKGHGYGVFWDGDRLTGSNRFALGQKLGRPLLSTEVARHTCDYPSCCNPAHLLLGTTANNNNDTVERRHHHNQKKTHCPRGHPYDRIVRRKQGLEQRRCSVCRQEGWAL